MDVDMDFEDEEIAGFVAIQTTLQRMYTIVGVVLAVVSVAIGRYYGKKSVVRGSNRLQHQIEAINRLVGDSDITSVEGPANAMENTDKEDNNDKDMPVQSEGGGGADAECANSATSPSFNSKKRKRKRPRTADAVFERLVDVVDKLVVAVERSNDMLEYIGSRMGYNHDLSNARKALNAEILKLPISRDDRLTTLDIIGGSAPRLDIFFSLSEED